MDKTNSKDFKSLVSIIVPVYNTDKKILRSCFDSLVNQKYNNIEIVLVDDGSKEETALFCDELASLDKRTKVVHQKNQGVSIARNNGTIAAEGDLIFYVDGDDVISKTSITEAVEYINKYNVDLVLAGVKKISSHNEFNYEGDSGNDHEVIDKNDFDFLRRHYIALNNSKLLNMNDNGYINRGPYCRLIKKIIAVSNPFPEGLPIGEDLLWNMSLLNKCSSICIVYKPWYGYLISESSAIRKYYGNRIEKVEEYLNLLWDTNKDFCINNIDVFGKNTAIEFYCILRYELLSCKCSLTSKEKNSTVKKMLNKRPWNVLKNKNVLKKLPTKYRGILLLCKVNMWQIALKTLYGRKGTKK